MGVARIFRGEHFFKKISKNSQKISKNIQKISTKYSKIFQKFFKNFSKKYSKNMQEIFKKQAKNFQKCRKFFLRKLLKIHYFSIIIVLSQFNNAWGQFLRVRTKYAICRNFLSKFLKIFESFLKKIAKNALFQHIYQRNLTNHVLIFAFG